MARFLGTSSGRTTTTYVDTTVNTACSQLCTYVNTTCSTLNGNINTACSQLCTYVNTCIGCACSQLCTYVNTCKVACNGSGAGLSNVVNSIAVAGTGISVNQSTGAVTITGTSSNDPRVLYNCNGCWNGSAIIPADLRGRYQSYEIQGATNCWAFFCSQAAFAFGGAPGCVANFEAYCCTQCSCGTLVRNGAGFVGCYQCAGAIAWPFGCGGGNYGCISACGPNGYGFHAFIFPGNPCDGADRSFRYCFTTTANASCGACQCGGVGNGGLAINCCGGFPSCLHGVCFSTPSSGNPFGGPANVVIIGHGRLT